MANVGKCPYCTGDAKRESGRVAGLSTHLAYGYGERIYRCTKCGETYRAYYCIPPKGSRKGMVKPREGIIGVGFSLGVRGFASPVVLSASAPEVTIKESCATPPPSETPEVTGQ